MFEEREDQLFLTSQEQTRDRNKQAVTIACILLPAATTLGNLFVDGWSWCVSGGGGCWRGEVEDRDIGSGAAAQLATEETVRLSQEEFSLYASA